VPRYSNVAIALHWAIAALVATLVVLGFYMTNLPRNTDERAFFVNLHKSLGILTLVLVVVRFGWRLSHEPPPLPAATPGWQRRGALLSHRLLYAVMLLQPVSGYLMSSFGEYGIKFFGLPMPAAGWPDPVVREWLADAHRTIAVILITLVVIHVCGAAVHGLVARDGVAQRMLPRRRRSGIPGVEVPPRDRGLSG
jgi:cytochrome b561